MRFDDRLISFRWDQIDRSAGKLLIWFDFRFMVERRRLLANRSSSSPFILLYSAESTFLSSIEFVTYRKRSPNPPFCSFLAIEWTYSYWVLLFLHWPIGRICFGRLIQSRCFQYWDTRFWCNFQVNRVSNWVCCTLHWVSLAVSSGQCWQVDVRANCVKYRTGLGSRNEWFHLEWLIFGCWSKSKNKDSTARQFQLEPWSICCD